MSINNYTIIFTGLGGQGLIRLLKILGSALVDKGFKVTTSETHGLSQRGGKVVCYLRFGSKPSAPIPIIASADMIVVTEKSCVLDVLEYAKSDKSTKIIVSTYEHRIIGKEYPSEEYMKTILSNNSDYIHNIPAMDIAENELNNSRIMNVIMLGFISKHLPLTQLDLVESIKREFDEKKIKINLAALKKGCAINLGK